MNLFPLQLCPHTWIQIVLISRLLLQINWINLRNYFYIIIMYSMISCIKLFFLLFRNIIISILDYNLNKNSCCFYCFPTFSNTFNIIFNLLNNKAIIYSFELQIFIFIKWIKKRENKKHTIMSLDLTVLKPPLRNTRQRLLFCFLSSRWRMTSS